MAHKLAIIIDNMLKYGKPYLDRGAEYCEQQYRQRALKSFSRATPDSRPASRGAFGPLPAEAQHEELLRRVNCANDVPEPSAVAVAAVALPGSLTRIYAHRR